MKKVFWIMMMVCIALSSYASDKNTNENVTASSGKVVEAYTVKGMVTDEVGESLPGVTVMVNGKKVFTDLDGQFKVSGVCKDCNIQISMISYQPQTISFDATSQKELKILLKQ